MKLTDDTTVSGQNDDNFLKTKENPESSSQNQDSQAVDVDNKRGNRSSGTLADDEESKKNIKLIKLNIANSLLSYIKENLSGFPGFPGFQLRRQLKNINDISYKIGLQTHEPEPEHFNDLIDKLINLIDSVKDNLKNPTWANETTLETLKLNNNLENSLLSFHICYRINTWVENVLNKKVNELFQELYQNHFKTLFEIYPTTKLFVLNTLTLKELLSTGVNDTKKICDEIKSGLNLSDGLAGMHNNAAVTIAAVYMDEAVRKKPRLSFHLQLDKQYVKHILDLHAMLFNVPMYEEDSTVNEWKATLPKAEGNSGQCSTLLDIVNRIYGETAVPGEASTPVATGVSEKGFRKVVGADARVNAGSSRFSPGTADGEIESDTSRHGRAVVRFFSTKEPNHMENETLSVDKSDQRVLNCGL